MEIEEDKGNEESMLGVEAGAISTRRHQKRHTDSSPGSTALASTPATRGLWSCTTSVKEWYPDEHPFIKNTTDTDDPNKTPYSVTTTGFPLYKRSYVMCQMDHKAPLGFKHNKGINYIDFPI